MPKALILRVGAPIRCHDIHPTIAVEIASGYPVPPSDIAGKAHLRCSLAESPVIISKHPHRTPLARYDQIRKAIAIDIREHCGADQPEARERARILLIKN